MGGLERDEMLIEKGRELERARAQVLVDALMTIVTSGKDHWDGTKWMGREALKEYNSEK